jgi:hypothetical protein
MKLNNIILNNYWVEEEIKKREEETHIHIPKNV